MTTPFLDLIIDRFADKITEATVGKDQIVTIVVIKECLIDVAETLYNDADFDFKMLLDVCGVDYLHYGESQWRTNETTLTGFSRGCDEFLQENTDLSTPRFAVVYHLLSLTHNRRIRLKVFLQSEPLEVLSVYRIWNSANW